jgi:serine/threonine protein kinase
MGCCFKKKKFFYLLDKESNFISFSRKDFQEIKLIGKGSFGKVVLVKKDDKYYAMKILKKKFLREFKQQFNTKNERNLMIQLNFPFIIKLNYAFQDVKKLYIVSEFMQGGELFYHLHRETFFSEEKIRFYASEIILALEFLHNNNIIYRDIKPENILLDKSGHIKLIDFGLCKILKTNQKKTYSICGTLNYIAPEIFSKQGYSFSVDFWSLGILIYEMLTGKYPFNLDSSNLNDDTYKTPIKLYNNFSEEIKSLLLGLIQYDPLLRLGKNDINEIKNHIFFKDINWNDLLEKKIIPPFIPQLDNDEDLKYFDKQFTNEKLDDSIINATNQSLIPNTNEYINFSYVDNDQFKVN